MAGLHRLHPSLRSTNTIPPLTNTTSGLQIPGRSHRASYSLADMALPSPPFIPVAGIPNLRDIGGYPVHSPRGHLIRPGIVFRSADPSGVTPPGLTTLLTDLRVAHVYDLRSPAEATRFAAAPSPLAPIRSLIPVFPDRDYGPEAIALRFRNYASDDGTSGFVAAYRGILEAGKGSFARVLRHLAAEGDIKPLLVNCTAGKDRTGVACALVLSLCGVEDAVVAYEFGLTELGLADKRAEYLRHLQAMPLFQENPAGAERMLSARFVLCPQFTPRYVDFADNGQAGEYAGDAGADKGRVWLRGGVCEDRVRVVGRGD